MHFCKPVLTAVLSFMLLLSMPLCSFADNALTQQSDGSYLLFDGSSITGVQSRGIDVSHWQGSIDWKKAAGNDVDFAMLGVRYSGATDPFFVENVKGAAAAGIKIGVYIYSYAMTPEEASAEADFVLNLIKDHPISYPVAFDVEDEATQGTLSKAELTLIIKAFCEKISAAGYCPILYANDYWLINKLDMNALSAYPVWVAAYQRMHNWTNPVMWQATSTGSIDGISGNADIDLQFKDFSSHIPSDTWRQIGGTWYYYKNYTMQKNTLINDGTHTYYMNADGTINKSGWMTLSGKKYYLDPSSGAAAAGWKSLDGAWNYFSADGTETKGWQNDAGTWYYLDDHYAMKTGWLKDGGKSYYLKDSGAMKTGWLKDADGTWYFLGGDGAMQTGVVNVDNVLYHLGTDGKMLHDTTVEINGQKYTIDGNGVMSAAAEESTAETSASAESGSETTVESITGSSETASSGTASSGTVTPSSGTSGGPGVSSGNTGNASLEKP